jgi:endonuclease YncB( thermonuclease family)
MNKYSNFFFLFLYFIFFQQNTFAEKIIKGELNSNLYGTVKIIDGDSIEIKNEKIRFLGIDAFEKKQECIRKDGTKYKCGEAAISNLLMIISGQPVRCVTKKKDRYKRWLATCYIGMLDINENMVLYGNAFSYMSKKYKTAENEAKKVSAGAWAGEFIFPWEWRKIKKK